MTLAATYRRHISIITIDQSVGRGTMSTRQESTYGPYHRDPLPPNATADVGSWWPYLATRLAAEAGISARIRNTCRGGTSLIDDWTGHTGTLGVNAKAIAANATGFDPNSYLSAAWSSVSGLGGVDERWTIFCGTGQGDDTLGVRPIEYKGAMEQCCRYLLSQDPAMNFFLGFTVWKAGMTSAARTRYQAYAAAAWELVGELGAEYPNQFYKGARGTDIWSPASTPLADSVHLTDAGHLAFADAIFEHMLLSGRF